MKMSKYQTPCRYDFVGSFLRPQEVKQAKADYAEGKISEEEKDRIIDAAITDVVKKQKELGYHVITDGEFRRTYWHLDFMWGFEGVGHEQTGGGVQFQEQLFYPEILLPAVQIHRISHHHIPGTVHLHFPLQIHSLLLYHTDHLYKM